MNQDKPTDRLGIILLSGLALGGLGLLEPLLRFWERFHLLGVPWSWLLLAYLGSGIAIALAAGAVVAVGLATRAVQRRPVVIAAYFVSGTFALATVLVAAPLIRHELQLLRVTPPYGLLFPILTLIGLVLAIKLTPHLVSPMLSWLIAYPSGRISRARLTALLVFTGLTIPLVVSQDLRDSPRTIDRKPKVAMPRRPSGNAIRNVLLITMDGLRADHLSVYGYTRHTSPVLDSLATESVLFTHCFAQSGRTELSLGALLTSRYPAQHGARLAAGRIYYLPSGVETIAEGLRDAGLTTVGLMSSPFLRREWGMIQGFETIVGFYTGYAELLPVRYMFKLGILSAPQQVPRSDAPRAAAVVDEALRQLNRLRDEPFFLHVNLMDAYQPYAPPEPYQEAFRTEGAALTGAEALWADNRSVFSMLPAEDELLSEADLKRIVDFYDGAIRYADDQLGRLIRGLDALGLDDNTLLIFTSIHGAEFLEHGNVFDQAPFLYEELLHVPLLVRVPGLRQERRVSEIVRHIDLLPTLREVFTLPAVPSAQGQSMMPLLRGARGWSSVPAFSQSYRCSAVRTLTHKLLYDEEEDRYACFDLVNDPAEQAPLTRGNAAAYDEGSTCDRLQGDLRAFWDQISDIPVQTQP